tara:strand:- start:2350 stop:3210 length:861 start_codon:yes stop_codon:yes gene_type:complete
MRNKVLEKISEYFNFDQEIYLLLGDLGVFQSREAKKIDPVRCINYGIMEQSMIGFGAGISKANGFPIIYSITPFLIERCFEQLKLDFGYNRAKGLIITAGGSYDYNKLGPTHYCPNDISLIIKTDCKNIFLPWNEEDAIEAIISILDNKNFSYLRLSSEEINEDKPLDLLTFNYKDFKNINIGIGPDSLLISRYLNIELHFSMKIINEKHIKKILNIISKGINIKIIAGFNLDFLLNLLSEYKQAFENNHNASLDLVYCMGTKFDTAEKKITHFTSNLNYFSLIIK